MYLKWAPITYYCHKTSFENVSQDRGSWLFLPDRAWDIILGSGRERAHVYEEVFFTTFSLSGFFELERNWIWLASVGKWTVSWVTDYFFIQFYVSAIFHNDWTRKMKRWKERLCIMSTVFSWHSTSVSSTEFTTELSTIWTVRDSARCIEWKVQHEVFTQVVTQLDTVRFDGNSSEIQHACSTEFNTRCVQLNTRRGEWKLNSDCIKWKVLLLHCTPLHFRHVLHFTLFTASTLYTSFTLLHFILFGEWKG